MNFRCSYLENGRIGGGKQCALTSNFHEVAMHMNCFIFMHIFFHETKRISLNLYIYYIQTQKKYQYDYCSTHIIIEHITEALFNMTPI